MREKAGQGPGLGPGSLTTIPKSGTSAKLSLMTTNTLLAKASSRSTMSSLSAPSASSAHTQSNDDKRSVLPAKQGEQLKEEKNKKLIPNLAFSSTLTMMKPSLLSHQGGTGFSKLMSSHLNLCGTSTLSGSALSGHSCGSKLTQTGPVPGSSFLLSSSLIHTQPLMGSAHEEKPAASAHTAARPQKTASHSHTASRRIREVKVKTPRTTTKVQKGKPMKSAVEEDTYVEVIADIDVPQYDFKSSVEVKGIELPQFVPPERDTSLQLTRNMVDVDGMKRSLVNAVSASLIRAPDFRSHGDPVRKDFMKMAATMASYDAEFVLKVALYTRNELNIRTTANFLLAFSANHAPCRPYLRKYYCASIRLPSDWIEVAEQYQAFHDRALTQGSLPSALRRAMILKFPEFDKYQLGKYNKDGKKKKVPTATLR